MKAGCVDPPYMRDIWSINHSGAELRDYALERISFQAAGVGGCVHRNRCGHRQMVEAAGYAEAGRHTSPGQDWEFVCLSQHI